jgi:hypothetical protein
MNCELCGERGAHFSWWKGVLYQLCNECKDDLKHRAISVANASRAPISQKTKLDMDIDTFITTDHFRGWMRWAMSAKG